jgi:hypothetical protein
MLVVVFRMSILAESIAWSSARRVLRIARSTSTDAKEKKTK